MKQGKRKTVIFLFLVLVFCMSFQSYAKEAALSAKAAAITEGNSKTISIKNVKAGNIKSISVKSSNKKIASVKKNGKLKVIISAKAAGNAKITVILKIKSNNKIRTKKLYVSVKVKERVGGFSNFKVTSNSGGSVTAQIEGKIFSVRSGKSYIVKDRQYIKLTVQANTGYHIASYKENGKLLPMFSKSDRVILYYSPSKNYTIFVNFIKNQETTAPQTEAQTTPQTEAQTTPQTEAQTTPQTEAQTTPQTEPQIVRRHVTIINGTAQGGSDFAAGTKVTITAEPPKGMQFKNWEVNRGSVIFANINAATTSFIMPDSDVVITAEYETAVRTTDEVREHFKSYFYDETGNVKCNKLEGFSYAEWAVGATDGIRPLEVFKDITGMDVSVAESYSYKFVSSDVQSTISITGNITAGANAEYATMKISIPSCPEIQTIHIGSKQYFNGTNTEGITVIFIE